MQIRPLSITDPELRGLLDSAGAIVANHYLMQQFDAARVDVLNEDRADRLAEIQKKMKVQIRQDIALLKREIQTLESALALVNKLDLS